MITGERTTTTSVRRGLHPLAWWAWALALAAALTRTSNPVAVVAVVLAIVVVVLTCRQNDRWGRAFRGYLVLAAVVVAVRLIFHLLVGVEGTGPVLLDLPRVDLPAWGGGIDLLGPVRRTALLSALYGGAALGGLLLCFGAANSLADPVRALRSLPAALHPIATAVVVAVTVAPRLVTSVARVRRAQRLRGVTRGRAQRRWRGLRATVVPVLADALEHALALAASMDSRGYARTARPSRLVTAGSVVALLAAVVGTYGVLDAQAPRWLGAPVLILAAALGMGSAVVSGRRSRRTRYRPDPWRLRETLVAGSGVAAAAVAMGSGSFSASGLPGWPPVTWAIAVAVALALVPAGVAQSTRSEGAR